MAYWIIAFGFGTLFFGYQWLKATFLLDEAIHRLNCIGCLNDHVDKKISLGHWENGV